MSNNSTSDIPQAPTPVYLEMPEPVNAPASTIPTRSKAAVSPEAASQDELEQLKERIKSLENQLLKRPEVPRSDYNSIPTPNSGIETSETSFTGTIHVHYETRSFDRGPHNVTRSVTHKTRMFGQSHWMAALSLVSACCAAR
jgi:hypothetical protein